MDLMKDQRIKKTKQKIKKLHKRNPELLQKNENLDKVEVESKKNTPPGKKKRRREKGMNVDIGEPVKINIEDDSIKAVKEKKMKKSLRKEKRTNEERNTALTVQCNPLSTEAEDQFDQNGKSKKTERKRKKDHDPSKQCEKPLEKGEGDQVQVSHLSPGDEVSSKGMKRKSKKARTKRGDDYNSAKETKKSQEKGGEANEDGVYQISSGENDCSKGMKKWVVEYHQSRPGLNVLQQRIDDFITAHEAKLEEERKKREDQVTDGGWTVVVHHKGRKKTTDAESGITVGSVAQAVVEDKMAKKKQKEVGLDFYRFQRREAQRNEIMMLQSKFEQDKKRIQQLRAARKFRPY